MKLIITDSLIRFFFIKEFSLENIIISFLVKFSEKGEIFWEKIRFKNFFTLGWCKVLKINNDADQNIFFFRPLRGDKLLFDLVGVGGSSLRYTGSATVRLSGAPKTMGLRGRRVPHGRLSRGHPMVDFRLHVHVDFRRSLFSRQVISNF